METIKKAELIKLGGAPDARFAVFYQNSDEIYFCTTANAKHDESYWTEKGYTIKEVVD